MSSPLGVAIIPARSGSVRIKDKNIRPFLGHPMMAYSIAAAVNSECFADVMLSTDSEHYAAIGSHYGARPIQRPAATATDDATLVGVAQHAIDNATKHLGQSPSFFAILMPVCPLRNAGAVRDHIEIFLREQRDFQISVSNYLWTFPHWAVAVDQEQHGRGRWFWGREYLVRSQTLNALYCPSGAIWVTRTQPFLDQRKFYGSPWYGEPLPDPQGIDIDEIEEFHLAEALALGLQQLHGTSPVETITQSPFGAPDENES